MVFGRLRFPANSAYFQDVLLLPLGSVVSMLRAEQRFPKAVLQGTITYLTLRKGNSFSNAPLKKEYGIR